MIQAMMRNNVECVTHFGKDLKLLILLNSEACTSYSVCTSCREAKFRELVGNDCVCMSGYYEKSSMTELCEVCQETFW